MHISGIQAISTTRVPTVHTHLGQSTALPKHSLPFASDLIVTLHKKKKKCGCCNYHLERKDGDFIDMLLRISGEPAMETMDRATRGFSSPAPETAHHPASGTVGQQKLAAIHHV